LELLDDCLTTAALADEVDGIAGDCDDILLFLLNGSFGKLDDFLNNNT